MLFSCLCKRRWRKLVRAAARPAGRPLGVEPLEDRVTPAGVFAAGSAPGAPATVTVYDAATRQQKFTITPFDPSFTGGVNVAVGDVDGDGTADVIVGAGRGGGPAVNVYSGADGTLLKSFTVGDAASRAGASVAAADYDGDGLADVVIGTVRNGQPLVQVVRFSDGAVLHGYTPFTEADGVSVAVGDVNGDGTPDTVVGAGPGGGPRVVVFDGRTDAVLTSFYAFEPTFTGGVQVSAGDLDGDGRADIVAAAGSLGGPRVRAVSGATGRALVDFFAYDSRLRAGVSATPFDADGDGRLDLVTANGPGRPPDLKAFDGRTVAQLSVTLFPGVPASAAWKTAPPAATLTTTAPNPTRAAPLAFTAAFSEAVNGLSAAGLAVTNGAVSNLTRVDAKTYTFDVTPAGEGAVTVRVSAGAATDAAGNPNTASAAVSRTFDSTAPVVTVNARTTNDTTPTLTGTVSGSAASVSVSVGGQTVAATVSGSTWTATVPVPLAEGTYTVLATATDAAGNTGTGSGSLVVDTTAPGVTVSSTAPDPTGTSPIPFTVAFSEDVTGFTASDLIVTNGTATGFTSVDARTYAFSLVPTGPGVVSVSVPAQAATDAAGNGNTASNTASRTFQTGAIGLAADQLMTNNTSPTLTGTVSDPTATVTVTVGGQTLTAVVSGTSWSAAITAPLAEGVYDIQVSASNPAGDTGSTTLTGGLVIDTTAPTATVSTTASGPTNAAAVPFTVTFNEDVTGFGTDGLSVQNGSVSNFTRVDARTYTFDVAPAADGLVTVAVTAGAAADAAGNGTAASNTVSVTSDRTAPTPTVSSSAPAVTTDNPIPFTVTFDEDVTGFTAAGVTVANGSVFGFTPVDARTYTFGVVPAGPGDVTVSVAAGAAADPAGNGNAASNALTRTFTGAVTAAAISTTATDPTNLSPVPFTATFTDDVTGFDQTDLTVTNGTVSNFVAVDARTYTFDVAPGADGPVTVGVAAGAATDASGNPTAAAGITIISDRTAPTAVVSTTAASRTNASSLPFTVTFDEVVTDLDETGLSVANGTVSNFTRVDGRTYTFDVTPVADGGVVVSVPAGAVRDAAGNGNTASSPVTITSDRTAPTVGITTAESDPTAAGVIPFTVAFSEDVTGFDESGLLVTNGAVSNFVAVDARTYTFDVAPAGDGMVTVSVPAGAAQDLAGNGNAAGTFGIMSGRFAPTATISSTAGPATNVSPIPFLVTFSEDVTGFDESGLLVTNGTVSHFTQLDPRTYMLDVTPDAEGAVTVSVLAGAAQDVSGNPNPASAPLAVTYDVTAPDAPVIAGLDPATDTGSSDADGVTGNPAPTIAGTAEPGSTVGVLVDDGRGGGPVSLGTATAGGDGAWALTPAAPLADGAYTLTATATDAAGNASGPSAAFALVIDTTDPTADIASAESDPTNAALLPFTVTFDEDVIGFRDDGLSVTNGSVLNFVAVDARTYTFDVAPDGDGLVTVTVTAGAAQDAAGNPNTTSTTFLLTSDRTAPTAAVTTTEADPSSADVIPFTITFSEDVTGFDDTGLLVINGTVSNFVAVDARSYTFDVTPAADGLVTVTVLAGAAADAAGNESPAVTFSITSERPAPTAVVSSTAGPAANASPIPFQVTFSKDVTGFDDTGLAVTNGTVSTFVQVSPRVYAFEVTPDAEGDVTVSVLADAARDAFGKRNPASDPLTVTYDATAPAGTISAADPTGADPIAFTVVFDEDVTGLTADGVQVANGTVVAVSRTGARTFTVEVSPAADGSVALTVLAGTTTDLAGNPNALFELTVTSDRTAPDAPVVVGLDPATDTGSSDADGVTGNPAPTITGTAEPGSTVGVLADDGRGGGPVSLGTTTVGGDGAWALTPAAPLADGTYTLTATATDAAGNASGPSAAFTLVIDTVAPTVVIDTVAVPTATGTADDEAGSGVALVEVSVQDPDSGLYWDPDASGFTSPDPAFAWAVDTSPDQNWATWSFDFPAPAGEYAVRARVTDHAGNTHTAAATVTVSPL